MPATIDRRVEVLTGLRITLEAALERASSARKADDALGLTMIGRTSRGLGVRPRILERRPNGELVLGFTVAQARTMLKRVRRELAKAADAH